MAGPTSLISGSAPRLGLGLAAVGRPGYINLDRPNDLGGSADRSPEMLKERAWSVLDAAWASGIRYFDCARSYGMSEEFLSSWLVSRGVSKADVAVGSKWGYRYTANWKVDTGGAPHEIKDHSLEHLESQLQESVVLLGDNLWLYQIHSATLQSGVLEDPTVLDRLRKLKEERGWLIGLSLSGVGQSDALYKAMQCGGLFDAVQATWNVMEQSVGPALERAYGEHGIQVIIKEALANGRALQKPLLQSAAARLGSTPDALALAVVMVQPFKPIVLSGAVTVAQVHSNMGAVALADRLRNEERGTLEELMRELRVDPADYWTERSQMEWA